MRGLVLFAATTVMAIFGRATLDHPGSLARKGSHSGEHLLGRRASLVGSGLGRGCSAMKLGEICLAPGLVGGLVGKVLHLRGGVDDGSVHEGMGEVEAKVEITAERRADLVQNCSTSKQESDWQPPGLSVSTFNIWCPIFRRMGTVQAENGVNRSVFESEVEENYMERLKGVMDLIIETDSDIVCLQEFWVQVRADVHTYPVREIGRDVCSFMLARMYSHAYAPPHKHTHPPFTTHCLFSSLHLFLPLCCLPVHSEILSRHRTTRLSTCSRMAFSTGISGSSLSAHANVGTEY